MTSQPNDDKVALVTGANKGIGRAIAEGLAARGMTVLLGARDPDLGEKAAADLRDAGHDARFVWLDVTDDASVRAAAGTVAAAPGRLDVLVNNAGISGGPNDPPSQADLDRVRRVFDTNLFGVMRVTSALLPLLRRSPAARIVNVSSGTGSLTHMTDPGHYFWDLGAAAAYPQSKAALNMLTVQYAKQLRGTGILVNAVAPGACATDFVTEHIRAGRTITRTAEQGAAIAIAMATLPDGGPTGGFFDDDGPVPW
ncbi:SDR family NAD(P)-dependent oxidoreductase [Actinomadura sp. LD22]|uniref:SDR family NAD(P)-dependent oxidoreductase n=1 Tax=Actinomadura physcomitrii TaxID=2650748 RepID=A0A6I4MS50_9ACTN|nr:SDR family oxidoreductase [Actinomadura physcomitrii]MWA06657.1 SDR family NAD(P)-dependent oxidoreductase [Actinomadura physcomitrii]